jgi:hypothetical protein
VRLRNGGDEGEQTQFRLRPQLAPVLRFDHAIRVFRSQDDARIATRLDAGARAQADRRVERLCTRMKQVERPDVDGATREIDAGRRRRSDGHKGL